MKINVKQSHIDEGKHESPFYCPVALAIRAKKQAYVWVASAYLEIDGRTAPLPARVKRFIYNFDRGRKVRPMSFEMKLLDR